MGTIIGSTDSGLLPAPAGVILVFQRAKRGAGTAPRARGGDPAISDTDCTTVFCSPRPRG